MQRSRVRIPLKPWFFFSGFFFPIATAVQKWIISYTSFGPRYQGHSRFSKNYPPCPSLTAISCLYTIMMMFLKGIWREQKSNRQIFPHKIILRNYFFKSAHVYFTDGVVTHYFCHNGNHVVEPGWWTVVCNPAKLSSNWLCKALGLVIVILLEIRTLIFLWGRL